MTAPRPRANAFAAAFCPAEGGVRQGAFQSLAHACLWAIQEADAMGQPGELFDATGVLVAIIKAEPCALNGYIAVKATPVRSPEATEALTRLRANGWSPAPADGEVLDALDAYAQACAYASRTSPKTCEVTRARLLALLGLKDR